MAIEADKLICIVDGRILDQNGRLIRFLTLEDADLLIRKRATQSETAANYVKKVDEEDIIRKKVEQSEIAANYVNDASEENTVSSYNPHFKSTNNSPSSNKGFSETYNATFQNGVGFDNGNGLWAGEQGFAIGGEERLSRLNGYLSELAAAAFVCQVRLLVHFNTILRT